MKLVRGLIPLLLLLSIVQISVAEQVPEIVVEFVTTSSTVSEGDELAVVLRASIGDEEATENYSIDVTVIEDSATEGEDFIDVDPVYSVPCSSPFVPCDANQTIEQPVLELIDDDLVEGTEVVTFTLSNPQGPGLTLGANTTHTLTITDNDAPATQQPPRINPLDQAVVTGANFTPNFEFEHIDGIEWYGMWIGTTTPAVTTALYQWYPAFDNSNGASTGEGICDAVSGVCTVPDDIYVINGDYVWWMTYWGPLAEDVENQWNSTTFTVNFAAPGTITRNAPSVPYNTLTWERDPNVLWYQLWSGTLSPVTTAAHGWYEADEICTATLCTLPLKRSLTAGSYAWWMEAWGPGGYATWAENGEFTYTVE